MTSSCKKTIKYFHMVLIGRTQIGLQGGHKWISLFRLYWITKRAGESSGSGLMKVSAWHHRADAVSSLVALVRVVDKADDSTSYRSCFQLQGSGFKLQTLNLSFEDEEDIN